jgi:hypothetical protein
MMRPAQVTSVESGSGYAPAWSDAASEAGGVPNGSTPNSRGGHTPAISRQGPADVSFYPQPRPFSTTPPAFSRSGWARSGAASAVLLEQASARTGVAAAEVGAAHGGSAVAVAATADILVAWAFTRQPRTDLPRDQLSSPEAQEPNRPNQTPG